MGCLTVTYMGKTLRITLDRPFFVARGAVDEDRDENDVLDTKDDLEKSKSKQSCQCVGVCKSDKMSIEVTVKNRVAASVFQ